MNTLGFTRVAAASPETKPGDVEFNTGNIIKTVEKAAAEGSDFIVFPELSVTGYTCSDLFYQENLLSAARKALKEVAESTRNKSIVAIVGIPLRAGTSLYNCAAVAAYGKIWGIVPKTHLPNYNEFYEKRWFSVPEEGMPAEIELDGTKIPFGNRIIFKAADTFFGIELCEDLWVPVPPSCALSMHGADIIFNLSASNEQAGKHNYLKSLIMQQSARCRCGYVYASAGIGESSTDLAFSGNCIIAENGTILGDAERFSLSPSLLVRDIDVDLLRNDRQKFSSFSDGYQGMPPMTVISISDTTEDGNEADKNDKDTLCSGGHKLMRRISANPFTDGDEKCFRERCWEISSIQAWGLLQRMRAIGATKAVIGISGGLDSTLALLVTVKAFDLLGLDRKGIIAITMPGYGTTTRTHDNASELMRLLGVTAMEIPIGEAVAGHFKDIGHDPEVHDTTYENCQARERTQILMDMANKTGGLVIGTGDLSELALGWCTYNGDQMSMYGVNTSVPKTLVKYLVKGYADSADNEAVKNVLLDIVDTPISPELLPANVDGSIDQKTEDLVGPYELHDFFLYNMLRNSFSPTKIYHLACVAFAGRYTNDTIKKWLRTFYRRFFSQQFKRSCMPDGVKVGSVCLSPRGDWRMPSDASSALWIREVDNLE